MESVQSESRKEMQFSCSFLDSMPTPIQNIISWQCPIKSGTILGLWIALVIMIRSLSFLSVFAYCGLSLILFSLAFRVYSNFVNNSAVHPLQDFLQKDLSHHLQRISSIVHYQTEEPNSELNQTVNYLRDIFLLHSYSDVTKFLFSMMGLVYIGMWIDMLDLVTVVILSLMTGPKMYCMYKTDIDIVAGKVKEQVLIRVHLVKEKLSSMPFIGQKVKQL